SQQDVGRFIEVAAGVEPPSGLAEAVHTQTEGNPLFVTEVVRLLVQEGELSQEAGVRDSWTVRIPEGVREVIGRRLNRLSQRCNETLTIASVIGREFELHQLTPLLDDISEDRLLEVLEEALSARVIEELPQAVGRYQFTHALIQETLSEELTLTRRVRLHARIAEALEELYGDDAESHAAELAHHFALAEMAAGTEKLVKYSLLAGDRALATYAWEEALAHFQRARDAKGEPPMDTEAADLLFGIGRAQAAVLPASQLQDAVNNLTRAFDYYAKTGEVSRAVTVAEHPLPIALGHVTGVAQLIARALELISPDSLQAGRLLANYGWILSMEEGDYQGAQETFSRALNIAQREGDEGLELEVLANAAEAGSYHGYYQEVLENGFRAIELARKVDNPRAENTARFWVMVALIIRGDLNRASQIADEMSSSAERLHHHFYLAGRVFTAQSYLAVSKGEWQAARGYIDQGLLVSPRESRLLFVRAILEYEVGDFKQGEAHLERLLEVAMTSASELTLENCFVAFLIPRVARITGATSRFDIAEAFAEAALSSLQAFVPLAAMARAGLGLIAVQREDAVAAERLYAEVDSTNINAMYGMQGSHLRGLLGQTVGSLEPAVAQFEDALALLRGGYRPELAWTCCDYADTLLQRNEPGDREKAMSLLDESLTISSELGMRPLMERVLSRREILRA
ncbi:MAG: hypothetical protein ACE1Y2_02950, partial [Stenotrophomonas maltophilia]